MSASWEHSLACAWFDGEPCTCKDPLFPPGCTCLSYGRGLSVTRVDSPNCRVHRPRPDYDSRLDHPERYTDGPV